MPAAEHTGHLRCHWDASSFSAPRCKCGKPAVPSGETAACGGWALRAELLCRRLLLCVGGSAALCHFELTDTFAAFCFSCPFHVLYTKLLGTRVKERKEFIQTLPLGQTNVSPGINYSTKRSIFSSSWLLSFA